MPRPPLEIGTHGRVATKRHGPGRWVARTRFRDSDGHTRQVEAWSTTEGKAQQALQKALTKRTAGGAVLTGESRVAALADYWIRQIEASTRSANTKTIYGRSVRSVITPRIGGLLLRETTTGRVDRFLADVGRQIGPSTARTARTCLTAMFTLAVREGALDVNPVRESTTVAPNPTVVRALGVREVQQLRAALREDEWAVDRDLGDLVDVMLGTGCRPGEALALRWSDVDLITGTVTVSGTVIRKKGEGVFRQATTKGKKTTTLWLPLFVVEMLEKRIATVPAGPLGIVFPDADGKLRDVTVVDRQWRGFRERHPEWSWITPKVFRKTVATTLARKAGLGAAGEQLTHGDVAVTKKFYVEAPEAATDHSRVLEVFGE